MGQQKRERKLTGPNTWPVVHITKGPSKSRGARWLWTCPALPEAGGRREGKGAGSAPRTASLSALQTGLQFLTKDFLSSGWSTPTGRVAARHRVHSPDWHWRGLGLGMQRGEGTLHLGRAHP